MENTEYEKEALDKYQYYLKAISTLEKHYKKGFFKWLEETHPSEEGIIRYYQTHRIALVGLCRK